MSLSTEFPDRLVTLSTGHHGLRASIQVDTREPGPTLLNQEHTQGGVAVLAFVSSDSTLDRYNEIISPAGWHLDTYRKNPVFQNAHQYGDVIFTLGRALTSELRDGKLYQEIQFATDVNPMARIAFGLYKGKFLNAVSVGFIPIRWEDPPSSSSSSSSSIRCRRRYLEQELLEVSAVAIPANPNALALAYKSGAIEKSDLKETADLINHTLSAPSLQHPNTPTLHHSNPPIHPILALVREIKELMKRA